MRKEVVLSFRAPGTDRNRPPPARGYLIKQSTSPITDLRPKRTYYYAIAARDNVTRRLGPRSLTLRVRTR